MKRTANLAQIRPNVVSYDIRPAPKKQEVKNEDQSILQEKNMQIKYFTTQNKVLNQ